jgi:hypothetical protein
LLEKQGNLIRQLRESEGKLLQVARGQIEYWQGKTFSDIIIQALP